MVSSEADLALRQAALAAGAVGLVPKAVPPAQLLAALQSALAGQPVEVGALTYLAGQAGSLTGMRASEPLWGENAAVQGWRQAGASREPGGEADSAADGEPGGLLPRQREILLLLGRGTPNKAIARRLGMSEMGVRAEVSWLTEQLGARSREEALVLAQARGWLAGGTS
jgi:DNA-binding NarL/FixJ family response regulator